MDKRTFLKTGALGLAGAATAGPGFGKGLQNAGFFAGPGDKITDASGKYVLPKLGYAYDALEPHIDKQTMELHHSKHHQGYVNGLNNATQKVEEAIASNDFSLIKHWERELAFHGSGHFLHTIFWDNMGPTAGTRSASLKKYIQKDFGSFDKFAAYYKAASKAVEGSGWGILAYQPYADKLLVLQAEKHHNLTQWITIPILVVDVWEHAYYLNYQNKRGAYLDGFFEVINWEAVSRRFERTLEQFKQ